MAAFQLEPGEKLLINDPHSTWMMMEMKPVSGKLRITQNRVVFEKPENAYFSFLKFMIKSLGASIIFEVKRSDITGVSKVEAAKTSRLKLETKFERPKMFETMKMDVIIGELSKTIAKPE
jgi:hypothetical protein